MKSIKWISASFEGVDGNLSSKKASVFFFNLLVAFMIFFTAWVKLKHPEASQVFPDIAWITVTGGAIGFSINQVVQSIKSKEYEK